MLRFLRQKTLLVSLTVIVLAILISAIFIINNSKDVVEVKAGSGDNVSGFAWSENIGWISFNTSDCDTNGNSTYDVGDTGPAGCPAPGTPFFDYGVNIDPTTGNFLGYAWSSNVGWISFEESEAPPDNHSFSTNCDDFNTCDEIADSCTACYNSTDDNVYGWAKILSLGDDGWLSFNCSNSGGECGAPVSNYFVDTTDTDFGAGALTDVVISGTGDAAVLELSAEEEWTTSYDTSEIYIYSLTHDSTNDVIYAGSADNGIIYRCDTSTGCNSASDWTISYDTPEKKIYSLTYDLTNDVIYAGTYDNGIIYRCDTSTGCDEGGDWTISYDTPEIFIYSLTYDSTNDVIYAGTFPNGIIYRCDTSTGCNSASDWTISYDTPGSSIVSFFHDSINDVIYVGSATNGIIYRCDTSTGCDAASDWTISYDSSDPSETFIYSLTHDSNNDVIYAGTAVNGIIYRCDTSTGCDEGGDWTISYDTPENSITSLVYNSTNGAIYAGTYDNGIIYRCDTSTGCDEGGDWTISYDTPEQIIYPLTYDSNNDVIYAGSAPSGIIYRKGEQYTSSGDFESQIFDAQDNSGFGTIVWQSTITADTSLVFKARTSNNADMSGALDWTSCSSLTNGQDLSSATGVTDSERYIQYYIEFSTTNGLVTPTVEDVTIEWLVPSGNDFGVSIDTDDDPYELTGWAWNGSDNGAGIGWINFNCGDYSTCNAGDNIGEACDDDSDCPNGVAGSCADTCATSDYKATEGVANNPPTAINLTAPNWSFDNACQSDDAKRARLDWEYSDPDDSPVGTDPQTAYQVVVSTDNDPAAPNVFDTGKTPTPGYPPATQEWVSLTLYDQPYYWWVKVWDSSDTESGWVRYDSATDTNNNDFNQFTFTTYLHEFPIPVFSWFPEEPSIDEEVQFTDASQIYSSGAAEDCTDSSCNWLWTNPTAVTPGTATIINDTASSTVIIFNFSDDSTTIKLEVTDGAGYSCSASTVPALDAGVRLPTWIEVK